MKTQELYFEKGKQSIRSKNGSRRFFKLIPLFMQTEMHEVWSARSAMNTSTTTAYSTAAF
jgi:hypothetical protein